MAEPLNHEVVPFFTFSLFRKLDCLSIDFQHLIEAMILVFQLQNNIVLTSKDDEVSRTDTSPFQN